MSPLRFYSIWSLQYLSNASFYHKLTLDNIRDEHRKKSLPNVVTKYKIAHWSNQNMRKRRQPSQINSFTTLLLQWIIFFICDITIPTFSQKNSSNKNRTNTFLNSNKQQKTLVSSLRFGKLILRRWNSELAKPGRKIGIVRFQVGEGKGETFRVRRNGEFRRKRAEWLLKYGSHPHRITLNGEFIHSVIRRRRGR